MSLKEIIKKYSSGKDSESMERLTEIISDFLSKHVSKEDFDCLCKCVYFSLEGGHYNKEFADEQIPKMYYEDTDGNKHYAPYWTDDAVKGIYEENKKFIPDVYNFYDFEVTLNMIKSDNHDLVEDWFKGEDNDKRYVEMALNWLIDKDNPFGTEKVWKYFNSK